MQTLSAWFKIIVTGDREASRQAAREIRKLLYSSGFDQVASKELKEVINNAPAEYAKISEPWRQENFVIAISVLYYLHDKDNQPDFLFPWLFKLLQHDRGNIRHAAVRMFRNEIGPLTYHLRFSDKQSNPFRQFTSKKAEEILFGLYTNLVTLLNDVWKDSDRKHKYVHSLPSSPHKSVQQVLACLIEYCGQKHVEQMEQKLKSSLPLNTKSNNNIIATKHMPKNRHKLTARDRDRLWGQDGPYSQVRLSEETRILDDSVSRVFLVVEAEINPFTFEYVQKHRQAFANDEAVLQLLEHAEYRGPHFGYVTCAGQTELDGKESMRFARKQADMAIQTLIRMHKFILDEFGLGKHADYGVLTDVKDVKNRFAWNIANDTIGPLPEAWDEKTLIGSPAGIENNKARMFFVLAYQKDFDYKTNFAMPLLKSLETAATDYRVDIENVQPFTDYVLITALIPFDIAPDKFITGIIKTTNGNAAKPIFKKDYMVTNVKKPSPDEIAAFLSQT